MSTTAERVAKHRSNPDNKRLELVLPVTTHTRYKDTLAAAIKAGTVTGNADFIALLLDRFITEGVTGNTQQPTGKAYAIKLLDANDRNATASRAQLKLELQQQFPGWSPDCGKHKKGTSFYTPQKIYDGVVPHLRAK